MDRRSRTRGARAFTVTELIVVMAIIGVLSGMVLTGVMAARKRGGITKTSALILSLEAAINQYEESYGDYPAGAGGVGGAELLYRALTSPKWTGQREFAPDETADTDSNGRLELVDHWLNPLNYYHHRSYAGPPRETTFRLSSSGPDGEEDTPDDISGYR